MTLRRRLAAALLAALGVDSNFWTLAAGDAARRRRDGADDDADDRGRDGRGAGRQGGRRLRRPEQLPPGRRLARDRADGRDRRVVGQRPAAIARGGRSSSSTGSTTRCSSRAGITFAGAGRRRARSSASVRARREPEAQPALEAAHERRRHACRRRERRPRCSTAACRVFPTGELPRDDDRGDRARGRHHRADPLPPLRVEARPLPRRASTSRGARCARSWEEAIEAEPDRRLWARRRWGRPTSRRRTARSQLAELWVQALSEAARTRRSAKACASRCARCTTTSPT